MVGRCVNPDCNIEFRFPNKGDLYAFEKRGANTQFFWLCSACVPQMVLHLDPDGEVAVSPRSGNAHGQPPHPDRNLRMVSYPMRHTPRRRITRGPLRAAGLAREVA